MFRLICKSMGLAVWSVLWLHLCAFTPKYHLGTPTNYNFQGEQLKFSLYWTIFHIANAETKVSLTTYQGKQCYLFYDQVSTAGLVVLFKRIKDWAKAFWDPAHNIPLYLEEHQEEGHYQKIKTYIFDYTKDQVIHTNKAMKGHEQHIKVIPILAKTFCDVHSAVYFFRKYGVFKVGETTTFPICTGTKFLNVKLKVVSEETIRSPWGKMKAFKIEPSAELNVKGVFSRKGKVYVWISSDSRHLPLKVKAKVKIGSVRAILTSAKCGNDNETINCR